jgi:hypothetical protein
MARGKESDPRKIDISGTVEKYKRNDDGTRTMRVGQEGSVRGRSGNWLSYRDGVLSIYEPLRQRKVAIWRIQST